MARPSLELRAEIGRADAEYDAYDNRLGARERYSAALLRIVAVALIELLGQHEDSA